ncbi:MAG: hypothetical protein V7723_15455 [Sneathiella sp.]|uniref:hypothetical protein n=1 Tax=Sneathiella sp. TaxID=1964365 RepID=UPI0030013251
MRTLFSLVLILLISGCAASTIAEAPVPETAAATPTVTAAQEAVLAATQNPFYTPLVGQYLAAANRDLPKKYPHVTVEKVAFINRDLITVFKYRSFGYSFVLFGNSDSNYWREIHTICRNPLYLDMGRNGYFFYTQTVVEREGTIIKSSLRPLRREECAARDFLT